MDELKNASEFSDAVMKIFKNELPDNCEVEKIVIEDGYLVFKHRKGFDYDINLDRLDDYRKIVGWIAHLNEKNWFTNDVLYIFLKVVDENFNGIISKAR